MIPYRAMLDVPAELLRYLSRLLAAERRHRGTPAGSRRLSCRDQAVLALRWFRDRTRIDALGRDHGVSRATAYRYVAEALDVLSAQAPGLPEALERALAEGVPYVILDGKVFAFRPLLRAADQRKRQARSTPGTPVRRTATAATSRPSSPDGLPLWTGPAEPGSVHDLTAARLHALPALYRAAALGMPSLADTATKAPESASSPRSKSPPGTRNSTPGPAPATRSCATCAAAANAGSPCSPSAGPPSSTSPPTPAAPPR